MDIRTYHVATYRAGEGGYLAPLRPDHFEVWHDSKRHVYERPRYAGQPLYGAREARAFIAAAWNSMNGRARITGRWPSYEVE